MLPSADPKLIFYILYVTLDFSSHQIKLSESAAPGLTAFPLSM